MAADGTSLVFAKLLVPIDDSPPARAATGVAIRLARECGAEIVFANAIDTRVIVDLGELVKDQAAALLARARDEAEAHSVRASTEILVGDLVPTLMAFAGECGAELIVMGTHARQGLEHFVLGSATEGVLRVATTPVLTLHREVVTEATGDAPTFSRLFVALDDSESSDAALVLAARYARARNAALTCCCVVETEGVLRNAAVYGFDPEPVLEQARETANALLGKAAAITSGMGVSAHGVVREDDAVIDGILRAAQDEEAGAIFVGTHGRRGLRRFLLGSVAEGVARDSTLPVFVTRYVAPAAETTVSSAPAK
jgi:nucleotide-binding universal stress UspA family protein